MGGTVIRRIHLRDLHMLRLHDIDSDGWKVVFPSDVEVDIEKRGDFG